ncbi:MAG: transcriptional regulator [Gammaproteobacteria bacterium]|nr:transcriptional regulator [Gammaproteobacteria bacterium]
MIDFDHRQLDEVIHSPLRLAIMAVLTAVESAEFTFLRDQVKATDGNLGAHLRKLEEAGYVQLTKRFVDRKPRTDCALTPAGRAAFAAYIDKLSSLLPAAHTVREDAR